MKRVDIASMPREGLEDYVRILEQTVAKQRNDLVILNEEYKSVWEVLRTYNPRNSELEYIGFVSEEQDGIE